MNSNPLTCADFYKTGHIAQYPEGTELVYSNFTPRSATHAPVVEGSFSKYKVINYGLQGFIKSFLIDKWNNEFFFQPKDKVIAKYKRRLETSLGPIDVSHFEALHDLGYMPIEIKALPEGAKVNIGVPLFTIRNTIPEFFWVTNYLETAISAELWKPITNATIAYEYRRILDRYAKRTGSPAEFVPWQGHDFSMRGMSGCDSAAVSGSAHLTSFYGTDTINAIDYLEDYYNADADKELIGGSVPATEHSVMAMATKENEVDTFRRLITKTYPTGIVSIVSDTWDFWKVLSEYTVELKDEILNRQPNALGFAKVVFRPDSGDPVKIVCGRNIRKVASVGEAKIILQNMAEIDADNLTAGECGNYSYEDIFNISGEILKIKIDVEWNRHDKTYYYIEEFGALVTEKVSLAPEEKGAVEVLWDIFGGTITDKGYKVLNQRVGLIYGDSITLARATEIKEQLEAKGFASCNIVFGIGSFTYQYNTRDSFGFAMKATYGVVNGEPREIFKDPKTDSGVKKSARGLLRVERHEGQYVLLDQQTVDQEQRGELKTVFNDGTLTREVSLAEIRALIQNED